MNTTTTNGRPQRKSLAVEIDRLERIVEALEDGLNATVAQVVREAVTVAVQQAIHAVIAEVMAQPELLQHLAHMNAPTPPVAVIAAPAVSSRVKEIWAGSRRKVCQIWNGLRTRLSNLGTRLRSKLPHVGEGVREGARNIWKHRGVVAVSAGIGLLLGVGGYAAGPVVSSLALGLCSAALSMGAFVLSPFVKLWRSFQPQPN